MAANDGKKSSVRITFDGDDIVAGGTIRAKTRNVLIILAFIIAPYLAQHLPDLYNLVRALLL
jgi:hypothetical protein